MVAKMISTDELCNYHNIEQRFFNALQNEGLIQITLINEKYCIVDEELPYVEKMIHLYQDLNINVEGIASIMHLLQQMDGLRNELCSIRNRLNFYEDV